MKPLPAMVLALVLAPLFAIDCTLTALAAPFPTGGAGWLNGMNQGSAQR